MLGGPTIATWRGAIRRRGRYSIVVIPIFRMNTRARLALTSRLLRLPLLPIIRLWLLLAGSDPAWILVAHLVVPVLLAILLAVLLRKLATTGNVLPLAPVHVVETSRAWSLSLHSPKTF